MTYQGKHRDGLGQDAATVREYSADEIASALTEQQAARKLGASVQTVKRMAEQRVLDHVIVGSGRGRRRYPLRALEEYAQLAAVPRSDDPARGAPPPAVWG